MRDYLDDSGAVPGLDEGVPEHFGDAAAELEAALQRCALADISEGSRLLGTGPDLLSLLHRLSTGDVESLAEGQGRPTVLTTAKGRIVERLIAQRLATGGLLIGGPGRGPAVIDHLKKFTFAEQTGLSEITAATRLLALVGPLADSALEHAGLRRPDPWAAVPATLGDLPVHLLGHDGRGCTGVSFLVDAERAGETWRRLLLSTEAVGGCAAGRLALETRRILSGSGSSGREWSEEFNPLEAGLAEAVSFTKGCYVGQEVVARLNTYDKVSRELLGVLYSVESGVPQLGTPLFAGDKVAGQATSALRPPGAPAAIGLAYVKKREAGPGDSLRCGSADGPDARLIRPPFELPRTD